MIIGDYANLIAVGKDFYGAFSGQNAPVNANFPQGVTYLRNANFGTGTLLGVDNVTPVSTSVDPFFVHFQTVEPRDDFYVRDWTDGPGSGDDGTEPSIKPAFYVTPDVWNRRGTLPGSFPNDQPENEDAGNGLGNIGDNWLFARIRRKAAAPGGSPDVTVNAHFLVSKLGTGSNYEDATDADPDITISGPDPTVTFGAADVGPETTAALQWHLNPIGSTHLCAAVEISTPADPFLNVTLHGRAPGWPTQDLEIVDDNNKAAAQHGSLHHARPRRGPFAFGRVRTGAQRRHVPARRADPLHDSAGGVAATERRVDRIARPERDPGQGDGDDRIGGHATRRKPMGGRRLRPAERQGIGNARRVLRRNG